jgi:hypothetical protein
MKPPCTTLERLAAMARLYQRAAAMTERLAFREPLPDEETLDLVLKQRSRLLKRIATLNRELAVDGPGNLVRLAGLDPAEEPAARTLIQRIEESLGELTRLSRRLVERVEEEKIRLSQELGRIGKGRKTVQAYKPFRGGVSYYVDRKS